jgi:hypothetical protein
MALVLRQLSLDASNCNWSVIRTVEESILTCTWSFVGEETVGVIGRLNHINFDKYGGAAVVSFYLERTTAGAHPKTYSKCGSRLLDTLQSMSPSVPLSLGKAAFLFGIQQTGFLSVDELDACMSRLHSRGSMFRKLWMRSYVAGIRAWDTSTVSLSSPPPTESEESDGADG